jgi:hypothetical protein|nr:MAG TPA: hypothetical protein [Caudoviricetes sp.]
MTKAGIRVIFRSKDPEEVAIGDYRYKYTVSPLLMARITSKSFYIDDGNSINQNTKTTLIFDTLLPNSPDDRLSRITHIVYMGTIYKVDKVRPYPPRAAITIDDIELSELKGELERIVKEASQKSQNDLKIDAFNKLNVKDVSDENPTPGTLVLSEGIIQIWDGTKYLDILKFIKEHTNGACTPNSTSNAVAPSSEGTTSAGISPGISPGTPIPDTDHSHWDEL